MQRYYEGLDQVQHDAALRSCGIAAQALMLAAKSMGYDSSTVDGFDFETVAELINLPDDHTICMFVAIGKSKKGRAPSKNKNLGNEVVTIDRF